MKEMGEWLRLNGEAIYGTRPVAPYCEGKVCLTQKKDGKTVYLLYLPDDDERRMPSKIWLSSFDLPKNAIISVLGNGEPLKWEQVGRGFMVHIPEKWQENPPGRFAWVLRVSLNK
jgi:alpha-L-fucosidase